MGIKDLIKMNDKQPTPETNAFAYLMGRELANNRRDLAAQAIAINELIKTHVAKIERERDEARRNAEVERLSGAAIVAICQRQESELSAMREAIKEACEALADLSERWEETPEWHNMAEHNSAWCGKIFTNVRQCKKSHDALAKLQPFLKL